MPTGHRDNVVFTVVVTLVVAVSALAMLVLIGLSGAPRTLMLATVLASVPVGPLVACYLWLDRYEPEPRLWLVMALAWGAAVATATALLLQGIGAFNGVTEAASLAVAAPVTEEATKGAFLVALLWWRRHELDGVLDGIVYAGMVGIGFAFTENILYLAAAYNGSEATGPGGVETLTTTFLVRGLASPFAHPLFTTFTGIGIGVAVASRSRFVRVVAPLAGYLLAVLTHGLWNGSTLSGLQGFVWVYVGLMMPVFVALVALAMWARRSEARMLRTSLADAARRGLIPYADIGWLADLQARRHSRAFARQHGGRAGERAMREYQQAAIELGFLHHRYLRGTAPADAAARGHAHLTRIQAVRPLVAFPGPAVPAGR